MTVLGVEISSGIVASAIDIVGALSSSAIVSSPIASLMVTFDGLDKVTMTVSSNSLILSETTVTGIFFEVSPALNAVSYTHLTLPTIYSV